MVAVIKNHKGLFALVFIGFILHSVLAFIPPLNGDEATFWEWSRHPALGYYAQPPLTGWLIALTTAVAGTSQYTVRLTSILLHFGTVIIIYCLAREITANRKPALTAALLYSLMPLSIVLGTMMTADGILIFCFSLATWFVKKAVIDQKTAAWYPAGLACGGMLLTKLMAVLFVPGVLLFLLIHRQYRSHLFRKEPYLAFLLSLLILSPNIYWNATNKWLTIQFNFFVRHKEQASTLLNPLIYTLGQMVSASPVIFILLLIALPVFFAALIKRLYRENTIDRSQDALLLLAFVTCFPLIFFLPISFSKEVSPHWPAVIYPSASILVAVFLYRSNGENRFSRLQKTKTLWVCILSSLTISVPIYTILVFPAILPDKMIYTPHVDARPPIGTHYFGWDEIGERVNEVRKTFENRPEGLFSFHY